jgi:hypothetical protein
MAREITVAQADAILVIDDAQERLAEMVDALQLSAGESAVVESSGAWWCVSVDSLGRPECDRFASYEQARAAQPITDDQIANLETESGAAGDLEQVQLCRAALRGDKRARNVCTAVIRDARAQL